MLIHSWLLDSTWNDISYRHIIEQELPRLQVVFRGHNSAAAVPNFLPIIPFCYITIQVFSAERCSRIFLLITGLFWPYRFCFEIIYLAWTICQASWWGLDPRYYFCSFDFILSICISFPFSLISTRHQRLSVLRRSYASCLTSTFQPIQGDKDQYKVGIRWKNDRSSTSCSQPCAGAWYLQSTY